MPFPTDGVHDDMKALDVQWKVKSLVGELGYVVMLSCDVTGCCNLHQVLYRSEGLKYASVPGSTSLVIALKHLVVHAPYEDPPCPYAYVVSKNMLRPRAESCLNEYNNDQHPLSPRWSFVFSLQHRLSPLARLTMCKLRHRYCTHCQVAFRIHYAHIHQHALIMSDSSHKSWYDACPLTRPVGCADARWRSSSSPECPGAGLGKPCTARCKIKIAPEMRVNRTNPIDKGLLRNEGILPVPTVKMAGSCLSA